jgi:hypothetical protein
MSEQEQEQEQPQIPPEVVEQLSRIPCCERDRDGDGNCDRHPHGLPLKGL